MRILFLKKFEILIVFNILSECRRRPPQNDSIEWKSIGVDRLGKKDM